MKFYGVKVALALVGIFSRSFAASVRRNTVRCSVCAAVVLGMAFGASAWAVVQAPTAATPAVDPFAPIAWMTGDWRAVTSPSAGHQPTTIEHHIHPVLGGKALSFVTTFNGVEQYRGLFAYDAGRKDIAFWYPSADGDLTSGTVLEAPGYILLDLMVTDSSGATAPYQVHINRSGNDDYDWALYSGAASDSKPTLSLHYHRIAN